MSLVAKLWSRNLQRENGTRLKRVSITLSTLELLYLIQSGMTNSGYSIPFGVIALYQPEIRYLDIILWIVRDHRKKKVQHAENN